MNKKYKYLRLKLLSKVNNFIIHNIVLIIIQLKYIKHNDNTRRDNYWNI